MCLKKKKKKRRKKKKEKTIGRKTWLKVDGEVSVIVVFMAVRPAVFTSSTQIYDK
jgi:hypothetical protein